MNKISATSLPAALHSYWHSPVTGNSYRYVGAGNSLYRDFASISSSFDGTSVPWPMVAMKPLLGATTFTYITDGTIKQKDNGTSLTTWGVSAPISQPTIALGSQRIKEIDYCESLFTGANAWTEPWGNAVVSLDTDFFAQGSMSLRLSTSAAIAEANKAGYLRRVFSTTVDLASFAASVASTEEDFIRVRLAINDATLMRDFGIKLGTGSWNQLFQVKYTLAEEPLKNLSDNTFLELLTAKKSFQRPADTTKTWSDVDRVRFDITFSGRVPASSALWIDDIALIGGQQLDGNYKVRYIFVENSGSLVTAKSNPYSGETSPDQITVHRRAISIAGLPSAGIKWIYRSFADDFSVFYWDGEVASNAATYESTKKDAELGEVLETDNDLPPTMSDIAGPHFDRVFGIDSAQKHKIVYSKAKVPDSFPPTNYLLVESPADPAQRLMMFEGLAYIWTKGAIYAIQGSDEDSFIVIKTRGERGTVAKRSVARSARGVYYLSSDGIWVFDGLQSMLLSQQIDPIFYNVSTLGIDYINMAQASVCRGAYFDSKYFLSYPHGSNTQPTRLLVYDEETSRFYMWNFTGARDLHVEKVNNYLVLGAGDGFAYYVENGLLGLNAADSVSNSVATIMTELRSAYDTGGYKATKDLYLDIDVPEASGLVLTPIIDGAAKTSITIAQTTDRAITRTRLPEYKGRLFRWRLASESFFRLFGISADMVKWDRAGYREQDLAEESK